MGNPEIDPDSPSPRAPRAKALDELAEKFLKEVQASGIPGYREFGDRLDGKPCQQLEHTGANGDALVVRIEASDAAL
jgi:hypothetical protein